MTDQIVSAPAGFVPSYAISFGAAGGAAAAVNAEESLPVADIPRRRLAVNRSSAIASAGVAQTLAAANAARRGFLIQNLSSGDVWINATGAASAGAGSLRVAPGQVYEFAAISCRPPRCRCSAPRFASPLPRGSGDPMPMRNIGAPPSSGNVIDEAELNARVAACGVPASSGDLVQLKSWLRSNKMLRETVAPAAPGVLLMGSGFNQMGSTAMPDRTASIPTATAASPAGTRPVRAEPGSGRSSPTGWLRRPVRGTAIIQFRYAPRSNFRPASARR